MIEKIVAYFRDERGSWVLPLIPAVLGFFGQQQAAQTSREASQAAQQGAASSKELSDYALGMRRNVFDPIMVNTLLPALKRRAETKAAWVPQATRWSQSLGAKMPFPTTDKPRPV